MEKLVIDGSMGEGGGQVLRTALAMSAVTGKAVEVRNIRANRPKPGLMPQHLLVARAFHDICGGKMEGAKASSSRLLFSPGDPIPGSYSFDVGTAGSTTLVVQGLLPMMMHTGGRWSLNIEGGTDVLWSPSWDYFSYIYKEHLGNMGADLSVRLKKRGFYPSGGGAIFVSLRPSKFRGLVLEDRGDLMGVAGRGILSKLPLEVWERMRAAILHRLIDFGSVTEEMLSVDHVLGSPDKAAGVTLWAEFQHTRLGSTCLGEKGLRAEMVGECAVDPLLKDIVAGATLDPWAADQLLPVMALAGEESVFLLRETTEHFLTVAELVQKFLGVDVKLSKENGTTRVEVGGVT